MRIQTTLEGLTLKFYNPETDTFRTIRITPWFVKTVQGNIKEDYEASQKYLLQAILNSHPTLLDWRKKCQQKLKTQSRS